MCGLGMDIPPQRDRLRPDAEFKSIRAEIRAEGEATRRQFDIVAEQMKDIVNVGAEGTARNTGRLDDHEIRLTRVERKKR
jgi:hypothetical protein